MRTNSDTFVHYDILQPFIAKIYLWALRIGTKTSLHLLRLMRLSRTQLFKMIWRKVPNLIYCVHRRYFPDIRVKNFRQTHEGNPLLTYNNRRYRQNLVCVWQGFLPSTTSSFKTSKCLTYIISLNSHSISMMERLVFLFPWGNETQKG